MRDNLVQVSLSSQFLCVCMFKWLIILSLSLWNSLSLISRDPCSRRRAWQLTQVYLPEQSAWTGKPGKLQSMKSQRVGHDWATKYILFKEVDKGSVGWMQAAVDSVKLYLKLVIYVDFWEANPSSDPSRWFGPKGIMNHCCLKTERVAINNKSFKFCKCSKLTLSHTSDLKLGKWTFISSQNDKYVIPLNIHLHNGWKHYIKMLGFERLIN